MYVGLRIKTDKGVEGTIIEIRQDMVTLQTMEGKDVVLKEEVKYYFDFMASTIDSPFGSWIPIEELGKTKGRKLTPDGRVIED